MQTNLEGKTVLVADAIRNFGGPTALAFAREKANLVLASRDDDDRLQRAASEAASLGVRAVTHVCDIGDETQTRALVRKALDEFGHIDVLVNNLLLPVETLPLAQVSFELWKQKVDAEILGSVALCREVLPSMIERRWGRVINFAGLAAFRGTDPLASTTEMGIIGLTRGIAREYGKYNITANCIGPGGIATEEDSRQQACPPGGHDALDRWGRPEEISFLAVSLASEDAGYLTGQCLLANGGKHYL